MSDLLAYALQGAVGIACLVYGVVAAVRKFGTISLPWRNRDEPTPRDDLRLVVDLAARLRDRKHTAAVEVCQKLVEQLLRPTEPLP